MAATTACSKPTTSPLQPVASAAPSVVAAEDLPDDVSAAFDGLQAALKAKLSAALQATGPANAVTACQAEAPVVTAAAQRDSLHLGRTSHALRNPANQPPRWAAAWVAAQGGRKISAGPKIGVVDLGTGGKGYLRAIGTAAICVQCHGPSEALDPALRSRLVAAYPADRALGFAENDLRGWFWAEVGPRTAP